MTLPEPDPAFRWSVEPWGHALRCRPLESVAQHLFTTRQLQLSSRSSAWTQAAASLGVGVEQVLRVTQVHGNTVRTIRAGEMSADVLAARPDADALVSNEPDVVLAVQVADCVPLLMADPRSGAAAAVHAGWRGTAAGIARVAIETMARAFGTRSEDLIVAVGPSIGTCCYEVGADLRDAFRGAGWSEADLMPWFSDDGGAVRLDLWAANRDQVRSAGVPAHQIHLSALCTKSNLEVFDSYRAEGAQAGRLAALIRTPSR